MEWTCLFVQLLKKLPLDGYERPLWCRLLQAVKERRVFREEPTLPCEGSSEFPAQTSTTSHLTLLQPPDWMRPGSGWPARVEAVALSSRKSECFTRQKKRKLRKKEAAVIVLPPLPLLLPVGEGGGNKHFHSLHKKLWPRTASLLQACASAVLFSLTTPELQPPMARNRTYFTRTQRRARKYCVYCKY